MSYTIINSREVVYSVGNMERVTHFFESYGGWNRVGSYKTERTVLDFWNMHDAAEADEILIQSNGVENGQLRLIKFRGVEQSCIRSSQQPWDTGGIMDINLRVHEVATSFDELRELGWHGLSDPLLQEMGPFKLYDILMKGYDDTIVAFTHRLQPPMELTADIKLPTHVYKTSITVRNLEEARLFYEDVLGFTMVTKYAVKKDKPQENMFGLPHNLADKVTCHAISFSPHGGKDVDFQIVKFDGVTGKDFSALAQPPHKGFMLYRVEVQGIEHYVSAVKTKGAVLLNELANLYIAPYGEVKVFSVKSPNGVIWEFFEKH